MSVFKQFRFQLGLRLTFLFLGLLLLAFGIANDIRTSLIIMLVIVDGILAISLVRYINQTNRELESFLAGLRFGDFQQSYTIAHLGPTFHSLEKTLQLAVNRFKNLRSEQEQQAVYYQTLMRHMPIPFLIIEGHELVHVLNNATRHTFNVANITNTEELAQFGAIFRRDVLQIQPGEALLTTIELAENKEYFILSGVGINGKV